MKQCSLSKRREQRSAQIMILITKRNRQPKASQTRSNYPVKQMPSRFSCRVITRHLAAQTEGLSQLHQQDRGHAVCLPCVSRRRDALCISISLIVPLPLIICLVSSLEIVVPYVLVWILSRTEIWGCSRR